MHGCQGACVVAGGHAWLWGGMCGCWGVGACVVLGGELGVCMVVGGTWLWGVMHGCRGCVWLWGGACVAAGVVHGCGGCAWLRGACMVVGGCVVVGGMHGCRGCVVVRGMHGCWGVGACIGYDEIQSMSGRYASYWNAFLLTIICHVLKYVHFSFVFCREFRTGLLSQQTIGCYK